MSRLFSLKCSVFALAVFGWSAANPLFADEASAPVSLEFLGSWNIYSKQKDLKEPSGLAFDPVTERLLVISDNNNRLYSVSTRGDSLTQMGAIDHLKDPEGVTLDAGSGRFLVLSEDQASIYVLPRDTLENVEKHELEDAAKNTSADVRDLLEGRFSPEGITVDVDSGSVFLVNERAPRVLIELSHDFSEILSVEELSARKGFAVDGVKDHHLDASGLEYDEKRRGLWIASDTGHSVFFWRLGQGPAMRFDLLWKHDDKIAQIENAEGIALSPAGDRLFIVNDSDKQSRLFVYAVH